MEKIVTVLGAGAWGTAISNLLAENGYDVILWCHESNVVKDIELTRINKDFLPGVSLHSKIRPTCDIQVAMQSSEFIFEAIPVKHIRSVFNLAKAYATKNHKFIVTSKGIEQNTVMLASQIVSDIFGAHTQVVALGGPNFAKDIAARTVTATVVASNDVEVATQVAQMLGNGYFKAYISSDIIGVQVGGAIKNIFALTIGMAHGLGYGENTIAFLMTRCLFELGILSKYFGGRQDTIYGLSGFGDLFLTCSSSVSKNFKFGKLLGQGMSLNELSNKYASIPEGINTVQAIKKLIDTNNLNLPVCLRTYDILFEGKAFKCLLDSIISQPIDYE
ncbi:MAG: Glycerol-3-phosphate dehydrogenase [NAD(P)+] [candidate division TM6 bacterium GW2011_GWF2_36_6]|jgi:glycerol-3-phosphate dehydrogenase (NAD(P)+)|nr:MAG: Glycerol-3-phosphate dehydrogenase [NAD(P)+] [candidate division TM6 bacterium GW2011_GWF2_36_6]